MPTRANKQSTECGHGYVAFRADIQRGIQKGGQTMTNSEPFDFGKYQRPFRNRAAESNNSEMQAGNLGDLLYQVSKNSTSEIDSLIGEFQRLREKLKTDSEHLRHDIEKYAELSQQVMQMTKVISESVEKFRPLVEAAQQTIN
jgi:methyl-accepting chemotaxis protein